MTPTDADSYETAFYEIAAMLGIPAQSKAPCEVWEQQMKPRLIAALRKEATANEIRYIDWHGMRLPVPQNNTEG